jgi:hypothetical protein
VLPFGAHRSPSLYPLFGGGVLPLGAHRNSSTRCSGEVCYPPGCIIIPLPVVRGRCVTMRVVQSNRDLVEARLGAAVPPGSLTLESGDIVGGNYFASRNFALVMV